MRVETFVEQIKKMGIDTIAGVPDSTLKVLCDYLNFGEEFNHYTTVDEGAALSLVAGTYLATGIPGCVYMQNSGIGNIVNPLTSMVNEKVYKIPMLFVIGWRGVPGEKDEPQHKFMGEITTKILDVLSVEYAVIDNKTSENEYYDVIKKAKKKLDEEQQFAIIIKPGTFEVAKFLDYTNNHVIEREEAIGKIFDNTEKEDILVSTTGKISRELYEYSEKERGNHNNIFMCVGGMGYASMIGYGIAAKKEKKKVYCLDGDGAMLMHMGNAAFIGNNPLKNYVHICINNSAHESVGGMPTAGKQTDFIEIANASGYKYVKLIENKEDLDKELKELKNIEGPVFLEIKVSIGSRSDLGRPKESAIQNKIIFKENI